MDADATSRPLGQCVYDDVQMNDPVAEFVAEGRRTALIENEQRGAASAF